MHPPFNLIIPPLVLHTIHHIIIIINIIIINILLLITIILISIPTTHLLPLNQL